MHVRLTLLSSLRSCAALPSARRPRSRGSSRTAAASRTGATALVLGLLALVPAAATWATPTTMTYAGRLENDQGPVTGSVDASFRIFDSIAGGTELYAEVIPALLVINGDLVAELGANALDDSILAQPELWLEISIDGDVLDPRVRLTSVPYALRAALAEVAEEALTLGGLLPTDVVTQAQLASLGLVDGLQVGAGLVRSGAVLAVANNGIVTAMIADGQVTSTKLAGDAVTSAAVLDGTIGTADLQNGAVTTTKLGLSAVGAAQLAQASVFTGQIANGTILAEDIRDGAISASKITGTIPLFRVGSAGCVESVGSVTTSVTCTQSSAGCSAGQRRDCLTDLCVQTTTTACANVRLGFIFP